MKILTRTVYADGRTYFWCRNIFSCRAWSLAWHPHVKECRYGWYRNDNPRFDAGLWMALNIPLLGDFSVWKHHL